MTELPADDADLEARFREHRIPRHLLHPWWQRCYRALGMNVKPPIRFTLTEHFLWEGGSIAAIMVIGGGLSHWLFGMPLMAMAPVAAMMVLIPLLNWQRYRRIRARISR